MIATVDPFSATVEPLVATDLRQHHPYPNVHAYLLQPPIPPQMTPPIVDPFRNGYPTIDSIH